MTNMEEVENEFDLLLCLWLVFSVDSFVMVCHLR